MSLLTRSSGARSMIVPCAGSPSSITVAPRPASASALDAEVPYRPLRSRVEATLGGLSRTHQPPRLSPAMPVRRDDRPPRLERV